jgi:hypothetical protein
MTLLILWMIWKVRNGCVFDGATPSVPGVVTKIRDEARIWARAEREACVSFCRTYGMYTNFS